VDTWKQGNNDDDEDYNEFLDDVRHDGIFFFEYIE